MRCDVADTRSPGWSGPSADLRSWRRIRDRRNQLSGRRLQLYAFLTLTITVLFVVVPGLLLAFAVRMRGWAGFGAAPLLTFALVLVAIVLAGALDIRWTPLHAGAIAAVVILIAAAGGAWQARSRRSRHGARQDRVDRNQNQKQDRVDQNRDHPRDHGQQPLAEDRLWSVLSVLGLAVGAGIGFLTIVHGTGNLGEPNQGFDALFHVNLVETITRSGDVSPAVAGNLNGYAPGASVYPDAFHAMASLISQLHGGSLVSINALVACIPLIAGLGLVALLRSMGLVREAAVAPIILSATTGYPTDPIWRGPIWVFVFGITFVPAFLVLLRYALAHRSVSSVLLLGVSAAGLTLIHPSAALSAAVFAFFLVGARWLSRPSYALRDLMAVGPAAVLAALLALPLIGKALIDSSGGTVVDWPVAQSAGEAFGELAFYNYDTAYPQIWLALPALLGLVVGWRYRPLRWWYAGTGAFVILCVMAASYEGRLVQILTGPWWNDRFRFAGLVFLGLSVFAAVGLVFLGDLLGSALVWATARWGTRPAVGRRSAALGGVLVAVLLLGWLSKGFYVSQNEDQFQIAYVPQGGLTVGPADLQAFAVLKRLAGNGPVLNDPNDGSAWMWSLAGVQPVFGAALTVPVTPPLPRSRQLVIDGLNCLDSDEDVRRAVADLGVRYVYSSDTTILGPPTTNVGFLDLSSVRSLRLVYAHDGASIYQLDPIPLEAAAQDSTCALG